MKFTPGKIVQELTLSDKKVEIRYPKWEDLNDVHSFINQLSQEQTFIRFCGEEISLEQEADFFAQSFKGMECENEVKLVAIVDGKFAGFTGIERDLENRTRRQHIGSFGISILPEFRGIGLGEALARSVIHEAQQHIEGLQQIELTVFGPNEIALNLYKKIGFQEVGRQPQGILHKGEYVDYVWMILPI